MKPILLFVLTSLVGLSAKSQSATDSVKAAVTDLFVAMKNSDGEFLKTCFADSAVLQSINRDTEGNLLVKNESVSQLAKSISSAAMGALDERITFDMIKVDGPLASVWTPYSFYFNGNFSHCGVNSFQLVRTKNGWKIQHLIDTRRKSGCL